MNETPETFGTGTITAKGPVSGVTVHAHMRQGPHAVLEYTLDLAVIVEMMFLLGEQARRDPAEPPVNLTPLVLLERLRERGVKSANGSRLVGRDALYESFARLRNKGYIRLVSHRADNKSAGVSYEFYEFPAWNPTPPPLPAESESSQVGAASGNAGSGNAGSRTKNRTSQSSSQVGAASGNAGSGIAGSRTRPGASSQVGAASGNAGSPPLPLGGGTTPPPTPSDGGPSQTEEEEESLRFTDEQLAEAQTFLGQLPGDWFVGPKDAKRIAPKLLAVLSERGWVLAEDAEALTAVLTKNPGGINNNVSVLESKRIPNLIPRAKYRAKGPKSPGKGSVRPADGPASVECDKGCDRGYLDLEEGVADCECLPLRLAAAAAAKA